MSEACLATLILVLLVDSPVFDLEIEDEVVVSLTAPNFRDLYIAIKLGPGDWLSFTEFCHSFGQAVQILFQ